LPPKVLTAWWPETPDELLRALQSYERLCAAHPAVVFEVVLFCKSLTPAAIESVLRAEDSLHAAGVLLAQGLDVFS
jgi:hypothetical protein